MFKNFSFLNRFNKPKAISYLRPIDKEICETKEWVNSANSINEALQFAKRFDILILSYFIRKRWNLSLEELNIQLAKKGIEIKIIKSIQ